MKNKQAFTLIELLVVVLIIGILAAVALPQYQKAVEKSKATQALTLLKSVGQATATYYMANGEAPKSFDELDVDIPAGWTGAEKAVNYDMIHDTRSNGEWSLQLYVSSETGRGVLMIGRLTGKYKGAGFWINNVNADNALQLFCTERRRLGVVFEQNEGDYCVKLFGATRMAGQEDATVQPYTMNW